MRETRTFTKTDPLTGRTSESEAYTEDGGRVWRWTSNDRVCPLDACEEYGIPCDVVAQEATRDRELDAFLAEYRANYRGPSAEQRAEARAAHGEGVELVNVITGETWTT